MAVMRAGHVDGTRGSGIVSNAADVIEMILVPGKRVWRGGECIIGLGFELYQSCGNMRSVGRVSVFGLR